MDECSGQICPTDHYTVTWSNNRFKDCLKCDKCHPGFGLYPKCGSSVTYPVKGIGCVPCVNGKTFSNDYNSAPCISCHGCVKHEIVAASCTRSSDTKCNGTCIQGYYYTKKPRHDCLRCSYCCFDGKDEIQQECVNQGLNTVKQHCIHRMDKTCGPNPTATSSSGKLLYNLAPRKAKDLWPILRREKGILRSQEFRVTLLCILDRRRNLSETGNLVLGACKNRVTTAASSIAWNGNDSAKS